MALCLAVLVIALVPVALAGDEDNNLDASDNICDPGEGPDVIVGDLTGVSRYPSSGNLGGIISFGVGTTSCNIGTCWLNWIANTAEHPVIGQNMYRLKNGRFEQIGQSWLKHGFTALQGNVCSSSCRSSNDGGLHLGVNCSDPYDSSLNASQSRLGAKWEVDAGSGVYAYPYTGQGTTGNSIFKRLQVHIEDLDPGQNAGAQYLVEGQYVTHDDASAKNGKNNASYRLATVSGTPGSGSYSVSVPSGQNTPPVTVRMHAAIEYWATSDPTVVQSFYDTDDGGRTILSAKVTALGGGVYHYEYAYFNQTSHRSVQAFSVPIPSGAHVTNVGFHDVDYHSGAPYDLTDWPSTVGATSVSWATQTFAQNQNANALRWGTLYNFRFDADVAPITGTVTATPFRPGQLATWTISTLVPNQCNSNGTCDPGETCNNCPSDCSGQGGGGGCCGNGTCEAGENPCRCPADCGVQHASEFPCGNGVDEDCDGLTDCADPECCTDLACAGSDPDGDGYAVCDCDNNNHDVWATPGEVKNVVLAKTGGSDTSLSWDTPTSPGGTVWSYDTLRSASSSDFMSATCLISVVPFSSDSTNPGPGEVLSYLVRASNACPQGDGTLGTNSAGQQRQGRTCP